jgi:hypothetical protein
MDCLDKVKIIKEKKPRVQKEKKEKKVKPVQALNNETDEVTSEMVNEKFNDIFLGLKKLESYIFKPVDESESGPKKPRQKKSVPVVPVLILNDD